MRLPPISVSIVAASLFLVACGPSADSGSNAGETELDPGSEMSSAESGVDVSCWLRDETMEEALNRPSPPGETDIVLGGHTGKVCYSRPFARGRVVEGGLIPFGEAWRLGANEATAIHLPVPARVGGIELEAGRYSLYTVAGESEWEFVLNSNADRWGIPINDAVRAADIGTFTALPRATAEPVEQLTLQWHADGADSGHVVVEWGSTRVEFEVALLDHE